MALGQGEADAAGFTVVRLVSGAATLAALYYVFGQKDKKQIRGSWSSAFFLFGYAIAFSFAYLGLTAATGALILFGCVQMTMIGVGIIRGERPTLLEWTGLAVAFAGLVYLVMPGLSAPPLVNSLLMAAAGAAWAFYTLAGKGSGDPLGDTAGNFVRSVPMVLLAAVPFLSQISMSGRGILLAVLSGAVASGMGYAVWYSALKHHTATRAAILQLAVPLITATGGVFLLSELAELRLLLAGSLILGGIALAILGRKRLT